MERILGRIGLVSLCIALLLAVAGQPARAASVIVNFIGSPEIGLLVEDKENGQVEFFLGNVGLDGSFVTDIFITDNDGLLSAPVIDNSGGVNFVQAPSPSGFSFLPVTSPTDGIGSGEYLSVLFTMLGSFAQVVGGLASGSMGMTVDVTDSLGNVSTFANAPVPVPAAIWLLSAGLGALPLLRRRRG